MACSRCIFRRARARWRSTSPSMRLACRSKCARCRSTGSEHRSPEFLAINPVGQVPTLLVDGRPLTEVAGCLFYLAKHFPEAALLPADDIEATAQAVSWMSFIAASVHPARRQGLEHAQRIYAIADRRL